MAETDTVGQQNAEPAKAGKGRRRNRVLIILGITLCVLALCIVFLPKPIARHVIADQLNKMGIVHEGVDTLEIDLWNQEVRVGPVAFRRSDAVPGTIGQFSLKLRLLNLLSRRAVVDQIIIDGVDLKVRRTREGAVSINGIAVQDFVVQVEGAPPPTPDNDPWGAALEKLRLRNSHLVLEQEDAGDLTVNIGRLDLDGFRTWEPEKPGKFDLDATLNGVSFKWRGEAHPFADKITLTINATVNDVEIAKIEKYFGSLGLERRSGTLSSRFNHDVALYADGRIDWATKGEMDIAKADIALAGQGGIGFDSAKATVTAQVFVLADKGVDLTSGVVVVVRNGRAATPDGQTVSIESLTLELPDLAGKILPDGTVQTTVTPRLAASSAKYAGPASAGIEALTLDMSDLDIKRAGVVVTVRGAGMAGLKAVSLAVPALDARQAADVVIGSLQAPVESLVLALADPPRWEAAFSMLAEDLMARIAAGNAADIRLKKMSVDGVRADQSLAIGMKALLLGGLNAKLTEKILPAAKSKPADATMKPAEKVSADGSAPTMQEGGVSIGRLALLDSGDIQFADASVTPAVDVKVAVERLEVANLDTGNPAQKSDLNFSARINEFTDLDLSGWAAPFGPKPDLDLKLSLKGLELPRFSPYAARAVGMHMESGQLNLGAVATAKQSVLDGRLDVNLRNLELGSLSPEDAKKLAGAVGMPVQTAVGLLQDSDKNIKLKVPVSGTVNDPEIDLSDAVRKAVGGALTSLFPPTGDRFDTPVGKQGRHCVRAGSFQARGCRAG